MTEGSGRALAALLFMTGGLYALDVFSSVHSSPYTAEVRGSDPENAARVRYYVRLSVTVALLIGLIGSLISGNVWPAVGAVIVTAGMWYLYDSALRRGGCDQESSLG